MRTLFSSLLALSTLIGASSTFAQSGKVVDPSSAPVPSASAASAPSPPPPLPLGSAGQASSGSPTHRLLTLKDALQAASQRQPSIQIAKAQTEAASARAGEARSGLLPQITASALYERVYGSGGVRAPASGSGTATVVGSGTNNIFSFGVSGTQLLWDFGQTYNRTRAADFAAGAAESTEHATEVSVVLQVRRSFFLARAQKALVRVAEETLSNLQKHTAQIEGFVRMGTRPEIDLAQQRTDLANGKVNLVSAQNAYATAKAQLNQAIGWSKAPDYDVADETIQALPSEDASIDSLVLEALSARGDMAALERQRESNERTVQAIRGAYGPTISAVAAASESGLALNALANGWDVGAVLTWPIFQGGLTRSQVREARANLAATLAQIEQLKLQVRFDIEQAALSVRAAKTIVEAANEALTNAREQLRLAESRYTAGVGSIIELGDAQVAASSAGAQYAQAELTLASARAQLLNALGQA